MGGFGDRDFFRQKIFAFFLSPAGPRDCRPKTDRSQDPPVHDLVFVAGKGLPDLSLRADVDHDPHMYRGISESSWQRVRCVSPAQDLDFSAFVRRNHHQ
jgi:hypothetical protein